MHKLAGYLKPILFVTHREVRDQFRDWRIIFPIVALTLLFPGLMNFTAGQVVSYVQQYGANLLATRFIPFLLMIVGFFPTTVSLVIALESFAGETERHSIEPLLSSPIADWQLYLGKLLASLIPPVAGSLLGITTYLIGVYRSVNWTAPLSFLIQIILLTTVQTLVMVCGAVVISTQTTSVRAANLLSSFIVIPIALLIQGEAVIMFWGSLDILWWVILGDLLIAILLIRAGLAHFNREELLGREIDVLNLKHSWRVFSKAFIGDAHNLSGWLRVELKKSLSRMLIPLVFSAIMIPLGAWIGARLAVQLNLPPDLFNLDQLVDLDPGIVSGMRSMGFMSLNGAVTVWLHNLRSILLATFLGIFSFGVLGLFILMLPMVMLGFFAQMASITGISPLTFLAAFMLPHGLLEIPAMILSAAAIFRLGATLITPAQDQTISESWLKGLADWARIMVALVIPLFLLAALVEVFITPHTLVILLGQ